MWEIYLLRKSPHMRHQMKKHWSVPQPRYEVANRCAQGRANIKAARDRYDSSAQRPWPRCVASPRHNRLRRQRWDGIGTARTMSLAEVNYGCVKPYQKILAFIGVADSDRTLAKLMGPVRGKAEVRLVPSAWQRIIRPRKIFRPPLRASRRLPPMVPRLYRVSVSFPRGSCASPTLHSQRGRP